MNMHTFNGKKTRVHYNNWSDNMTVQELINELNQIEDKSQRVIFECIGNRNVYDVNEIVGANIPKDDSCKEYERGILISNV